MWSHVRTLWPNEMYQAILLNDKESKSQIAMVRFENCMFFSVINASSINDVGI